MARGGHHGGGHHSGGHHGGGFHGGGYSGGYHGGYYGGGSGGRDHYSNSDAISDLIIRSSFMVFLILVYSVAQVANGDIQGLNLINLAVFITSGIIFIVALKQFGRTSALNTIKKSFKPSGKVWKGARNVERIGDLYTWAGKYEKNYCISFTDKDFGVENARKVKEMMGRTPGIIWMNPFVWLIIGVVSCFNTFWFCEIVIPHFENATMTDEAFAFMDEFVFYFPSIVTLISAVCCLVFVIVKDNLLYKCAIRIAEDNRAVEERLNTEEFISSALSEKWYHNFCPNCGAAANMTIRSCSYCGASLEVKSFGGGVPAAVHRISSEAEKEPADKTVEKEKDL